MVEAEKTIPAIVQAIKEGKTEVVTTPLSLPTMLRVSLNFFLGDRLKIPFRV